MRQVLAYIDYYDSFSNNLIDWLERQGFEVRRLYFDKLTIDPQFFSSFQGCILSPGPGDPSAMFAQINFAKTMLVSMPIFGVCLGHQLLSLAHNGTIARDPECFHGSTRRIVPLNSETPFEACLYNSLVVENVEQVNVVARCANNTIQAVKFPANGQLHRSAGVQFHPESFQSEQCQIFTSKLLRWCLERR